MSLNNVVILANVSKVYGYGKISVVALKDISLEVRKGEMVCVIGPSGSGKTTLLNIMGLLDRPTAGKVFFMNKDTSMLSDYEMSRIRCQHIGFIFQLFNLVPWFNAIENVELALIIAGISRKERRRKAIELLKKLGLGDRLYHKPSELSGGEQQRVAIARALANNPDLILADEPTGNLDTQTGLHIIRILANLAKEGRAIVIATHDERMVKEANKVVRLRDGKIVEIQKLKT